MQWHKLFPVSVLLALQLHLASVNVPAHTLGCYMQSCSGPCRLSSCTLWSSLVVTTYPRILCRAPCTVPSLLPAVFLVPSSSLLCSPATLTHLTEPCLFHWRTLGFHNFWWTCLPAPTRALFRILYKFCVYPVIHGCHPKGKHGTCNCEGFTVRKIHFPPEQRTTYNGSPQQTQRCWDYEVFSESTIAIKQHCHPNCLYLLVGIRGSTTMGDLSLLPFSDWFKAKDGDVWKSSLVSTVLLKARCMPEGAEVNPPECLWFSYFLVNLPKWCLMFAWHCLVFNSR